jgi:hypothetical protein
MTITVGARTSTAPNGIHTPRARAARTGRLARIQGPMAAVSGRGAVR